jgi:hypothetical protein
LGEVREAPRWRAARERVISGGRASVETGGGAEAGSESENERTILGERASATRLPGRRPAPRCAHGLFAATTPPTVPTAPASIAIPATRRSRRSPAPFLADSTSTGHRPANTIAGSNSAPFKYSSSVYTR